MDTFTLTVEQVDPAKLKAARKKLGLKLEEAARRTNTTTTNLVNYESGFSRPQLHTFARICRVYGVVNPFDLFSPVESPDAFSPRKRIQLSA